MTRSTSFVGTLKRFFKASHRSEESARLDGASLPGTPIKSSACLTPDAERCSFDIQVSQSLGGSDIFSLPFCSRNSVDRQFLASNSGPLISTSPRGAGVGQGHFHHSISDTCDNTSVRASLQRQPPADDGSWSFERRKQPPGGSSLRGTSLKLAARSDASLPSLYDVPTRSSSLDIQSAAISSPSLPGPAHAHTAAKANKQAVPVSLPSVDSHPHPHLQPPMRESGSQVPLPSGVGGCVDAPAAPAASPATLLALCPGAPAAMRRRQWSLEDFEVTCKIYKGSTSAVYKATCRRSGLPVALKVYSLSRVPPNVVHMIVREIKIHVELVHKHIVMLYAAFQDEKRLVLVQEYAGRGDLYGIYRSLNRRMSEAQLTHLVLAPFVEALVHLHARGICHRDIKPENVLFANDWRLLIADFGVSIDLNQERAVTRAGTLEYMAPEVERCPLKMLPEENKDNPELAYTTAVDIWAVGVLAYELLVGFPPFVVDNNGPGSAGASSGGGGHANGPGGAFLAEYATRKTLSFPASTSASVRDFISLALAERPEERPTALQLSRHPWLAAAMQQPVPRRSAGQLNNLNVTPLYPSRLGSNSLASAPNSGPVPASALVV